MEPKIAFDESMAQRYDDNFAPVQAVRDLLHLLTEVSLRGLVQPARILCVGAGTGLELSHLASLAPDWSFAAVEPSEPMLKRCRLRAQREGWEERCQFHQGTLDTFSQGNQFDAATSLLVSHFLLERAERLDFFRQIESRVKPQGVLVLADLAPEEDDTLLKDFWLDLMSRAGQDEDFQVKTRQAIGRDYANLGASLVPELLLEAGWSRMVRVGQMGCIYVWKVSK